MTAEQDLIDQLYKLHEELQSKDKEIEEMGVAYMNLHDATDREIDRLLKEIQRLTALNEAGEKVIDEFKESIKYALKEAIDNQEQEVDEDLNKGKEEAFIYCLEMIDKHVEAYNLLKNKK